MTAVAFLDLPVLRSEWYVHKTQAPAAASRSDETGRQQLPVDRVKWRLSRVQPFDCGSTEEQFSLVDAETHRGPPASPRVKRFGVKSRATNPVSGRWRALEGSLIWASMAGVSHCVLPRGFRSIWYAQF